MKQETNELSEMLVQVGVTAKAVGVQKLTEMLKDIQQKSKEITDEDYENSKYVVSVVCNQFDITVSDFYSNKRKNNRRHALGCVCFILDKYYGFDYKKIEFVIKKSFSYVSILISEIKDMNPNHPYDKKTLEKLNLAIKEITNKIKNKKDEPRIN
jgi:chromosomal replication initiation ATPase DnaA